MSAEEAEMKPELKWVVAGSKGMELHAHRCDNDEKVITITTGNTTWAFTFAGVEGAGKVRIGAGCNFNPLQMVESLWSMLMSHEPDTAIHISLDDLDLSDMNMNALNKELREDWT
jgi:hypothetical protein